ncbi:MAG: GntR family transcriptional regulator [Clostridia bacterium]|nr:GntR family transcriptional regulator [Clostridia bacterium]
MLDRLELSFLLDYYGSFLTDTQLEALRLSCEEDLSLSEIAEQKGISRQGVRDAIARGEKALLEMENKLHLVEKDRRIQKLVSSIAKELDSAGINADHEPKYAKLFSLLSELSDITEGNDGI